MQEGLEEEEEEEKEEWEKALEKTKRGIIPIRKRPFPRYKDAPMLVNTVSTVSILPKGYKLPLQFIATALSACSQFEPSQFAADIIKLINSTALVFSSGKIVLTATVTEMQTKYMAHVFRILIEKVECIIQDSIGNQMEIGTLAGRTVFENLQTHNMVGHGDLGVKVDLRALRNANPDSVKWLPDGFPAAKCCVWLTRDNACHCSNSVEDDPDVLKVVPKLLRKRCACTIKCLVFPTGKVVMTGGRCVRDINDVFYRMKSLAPHFEVGIGSILVPGTNEPTYNQTEKTKIRQTEDEAIKDLLDSVYKFKNKRIKTRTVNQANFLMTYAEHGTLESVKTALAIFEDEQGKKDVIEKLSLLERTPEQTAILEYLKKC